MRHYYRNLADVFVEVIKSERISPEELKKRFSFSGFELVINELNKGRSVIVAIGHFGNWEWMGTALGLLAPSKGFGIVKPLSQKHFHKYLESLRHRLNPGITIPFQHTYRTLIRHKMHGATFNIIAADQTPTRAEINYWSKFLNQDTPFYVGVEKLARTLDFTVVYIDIQRTGRGKYNGEIRLISKDPKATHDLEITEKYIRLLEESIRRRPDNWLWSHKRWKFERTGGQA
jgi:KDO2-lipid IV(A) lauroyltransferase